jgi:hypothetical protein
MIRQGVRPMAGPDNRESMLFVTNASQYYATARFAMHAQCMPVMGILFHHTVEMLLKGGLAQKRTLGELKDMEHRLKKKIWPAFKEDFPNPNLSRHDKTISSLDKFDAARYPNAILRHGMGGRAEWRGPVTEEIAHGGIRTVRPYLIEVRTIDDLVLTCSKYVVGTQVILWEPILPLEKPSNAKTTTRSS